MHSAFCVCVLHLEEMGNIGKEGRWSADSVGVGVGGGCF